MDYIVKSAISLTPVNPSSGDVSTCLEAALSRVSQDRLSISCVSQKLFFLQAGAAQPGSNAFFKARDLPEPLPREVRLVNSGCPPFWRLLFTQEAPKEVGFSPQFEFINPEARRQMSFQAAEQSAARTPYSGQTRLRTTCRLESTFEGCPDIETLICQPAKDKLAPCRCAVRVIGIKFTYGSTFWQIAWNMNKVYPHGAAWSVRQRRGGGVKKKNTDF